MKLIKEIAGEEAFSLLGHDGLNRLGAKWDNTVHAWTVEDEKVADFMASFWKESAASREAGKRESAKRQVDWVTHNARQTSVSRGAYYWVARADGIEILPSGLGYVRGSVGGQWKEAFGGSSQTTLLPVGTMLKVRWARSTSVGGNSRRSANVEVV
mgnify:CR=1 FL=1